ncbi:HNH endonuclease signature motif containing protein [Burkholderia cepacia]|uniref:HNH endonuclease signature motif containing protein n=1 Tax=Burkholderia cepacia TaxID=292 RepID=UPI000A4DEFC0|nr:HNH endonuclease signature motif containing protein [Burkholderia cepacia]
MRKLAESKNCKIEGCGRKAMYRQQQVCQKHYFRFMRTGNYHLLPKPQRTARRQDSRGYWQLYMPEHPLADSTGQVWEHRRIVYERYGDDLPPCELCGKLLTWSTVHIDHEDENPANNDPKNLRPLCRGCNVSRPLRMNSVNLTIGGVTKTAAAWSRDSAVTVCYATILKRKAKGLSDYEAVFGEKKTHNGKKAVKPPPKMRIAHERSNAIALTVNGVTKTAAEWAREERCTVSESAIRQRFRAGWTHDRAVFDPPKKVMNKKARRLQRRIEMKREAA